MTAVKSWPAPQKHGVAVAEKAVALGDGAGIGPTNRISPRKGHDQSEQGGARHISFAMMVAKPSFCRKIAFDADFIGLPIPDEFVFGMGMDYSGLYRNLPAIYCFCSDQ